MNERPLAVRLLEITVFAGAAISIAIEFSDGTSGVRFLWTSFFLLVSVALILLITRRRSLAAWAIQAVLAVLWVPYFLWNLINSFGELAPMELIKGYGLLGYTNLGVSILALFLLFSSGVRGWVDRRPIDSINSSG